MLVSIQNKKNPAPILSNEDNSGDAQAVLQEFKDYAYGVSHDVGAPVRAMVEFSKLITTEHAQNLNEEGKLYLSLIIESGEKLQKMMAGLLDYSRLNTEAKPFTGVDCNITLESALMFLGKKFDFSRECIDSAPLPNIYGDAQQLEQLFVVLLDNALKFQPPDSKAAIKIDARKEEGCWKFAIKDDGIGIAEWYQQKIFQIFQRLNPDREYPGVGIGLTLAQKIVRHHGGRIWVESVVGQGATFLFTIADKKT